MRFDSFIETLCILMMFIFLILFGIVILSPVEDVVTTGIINKISARDGYYGYEVDIGNRILYNLINTNYYELRSEHQVYFKQNAFGTSCEQFI